MKRVWFWNKGVKVMLDAKAVADGEFLIEGDADPVCRCGSDFKSVGFLEESTTMGTVNFAPRVLCGNCPAKYRVESSEIVESNVVVFRFDAGNDVNGNPRRVFVVLASESTDAYESGDALAYIDEGYGSDTEVRKRFPNYVGSYPTYATTVSEYRNLVKTGKTLVRKGA